jgi:hypothetical protein
MRTLLCAVSTYFDRVLEESEKGTYVEFISSAAPLNYSLHGYTWVATRSSPATLQGLSWKLSTTVSKVSRTSYPTTSHGASKQHVYRTRLVHTLKPLRSRTTSCEDSSLHTQSPSRGRVSLVLRCSASWIRLQNFGFSSRTLSFGAGRHGSCRLY